MYDSGLTTSNPYFNNEDIQENLTCENDETVKLRVDRFETYNGDDRLRITMSNATEYGEIIFVFSLFKSDVRILWSLELSKLQCGLSTGNLGKYQHDFHEAAVHI